jgi:hypothetical protein
MNKTIKVTLNIYGNYRGKISGSLTHCLGCNKYDAVEWLSDNLEHNKSLTIHPDSDLTQKDVDDYLK